MALFGLTVGMVVAAVAGGVVGAAIGALPALGISGVIIVIGELSPEDTFPDAAGPAGIVDVAAAPLDALGLTGAVGFGPVIGPHVAFAGGVAAAAYAGRKQVFDPTFRYHQAKQIARPLPPTVGTFLAGGAFGLLGVVVAALVAALSVPVDPVAFSIVLSAFVHRLVFGYPLLGRFDELDGSVLDMTSFEKGAYWGDEDHETAQGIGGRHVVEPWLPRYDEWQYAVAIGVGGGVVSGAIALLTDSVFLPFGLATASLLAVVAGVYELPVTYHVALPAGIAAVAVDGPAVLAVAFAGVFGVLAALLGEVAQRTLYAHADTHLDPAFASILLTSLLLSLLASVGALNAGPIPYPVL